LLVAGANPMIEDYDGTSVCGLIETRNDEPLLQLLKEFNYE
jgi:hypothetical protein